MECENKYIYRITVYIIWKWGASLIEEKYYSSNKPIEIKNKVVRKNGYSLQQFVDLINL